MKTSYEQEPLSHADLAAELAAGGIAMAAVVLVAFLAFQRISRPLDMTPSASLANHPGLALAARLSDVSRDSDSTTDDPPASSSAQSKGTPVDFLPGAGPAAMVKPQASAMGEAPTPLIRPVDASRTRDEFAPQSPKREREVPIPTPRGAMRDLSSRSGALWVQTKLRDLGYYSGSINGVWGPASRHALLDFKMMNGLQDGDRWDSETEKAVSSRQSVRVRDTFIGIWAKAIEACQIGRGARIVIQLGGAKIDRGKCDFHSIKREAATTWQIQADCSAEERTWRSNISLRLTASSLHWTSEHGVETYVRCPKS